MRGLPSLILAFCLFVGLTMGAVLHAAEAAGHGAAGAATEWLHLAGDHDEVPADADKNYPHHHNICHGHDLAAPAKASGPGVGVPARLPRPAADALPPAAPPGCPLRPPIA